MRSRGLKSASSSIVVHYNALWRLPRSTVGRRIMNERLNTLRAKPRLQTDDIRSVKQPFPSLLVGVNDAALPWTEKGS